MATGVPVMVLRGGTSKGAYFLAEDLPAELGRRDQLLLAVMGSPDPRQIDGIGGAHPLTSKVAVVSRSADPAADVDYLFLQVQVNAPVVSAEAPCGNILAGVGPFAIERGLVTPSGPVTAVRIRMVNTGSLATVHVPTPSGRVEYQGDTAIAGVPGTAARLLIDFRDTAGSVATALLPTGRRVEDVAGVAMTLIDNGMPVAILDATSVGATGYESPAELERNTALRERVESLRLCAGEVMGLGDVSAATVPKMCLVAPPTKGGSISTRMFIPHRVHSAIGVLAAITVGTATAIPGSVAAALARPVADPAVPSDVVRLEHPTGWFDAVVEVTEAVDDIRVGRSAIVSTARLLLEGAVHPRATSSNSGPTHASPAPNPGPTHAPPAPNSGPTHASPARVEGAS